MLKEDAFLVRMSQPNINTYGSWQTRDLSKGTKCQVLGQKNVSDSTYYFVKVEILEDEKKEYDKGIDIYRYGWIYKAYLE